MCQMGLQYPAGLSLVSFSLQHDVSSLSMRKDKYTVTLLLYLLPIHVEFTYYTSNERE